MQSAILITGGGSGLGRSLCEYLAQTGRRILITDRDLESARETLARLGENCQASAHRLDVTDEAEVAAFFEALTTPVDILINNAGLQHVAPLEEFE